MRVTPAGMKTKKRNMAEAVEPLRSWYALRVFHNRSVEVSLSVEKSGCEYYVPMKTVERKTGTGRSTVRQPIFPSLLFVRAEKSYVENIRKHPTGSVSVYCMPGMKEPAAISDEEMRMFIFVTTVGSRNLEAVDPALAKGDRVRITGGVFRGAEGYIARIRNAKRLIVAIEGVAAVATSYIPKDFIKKIDPTCSS